jgi:uncharacterized protein YndB with AHSA1/START domain
MTDMSELQVASIRTEIAAPAAFVWDVLVDLDKYSLWNPLNRRVESTLRVGDEVKLWISNADLSQAGAIFVHRLQAIDPPRHLAWGWTSDGPAEQGVRTRRDQYVEPIGAGRCTYYTTDTFMGPGAAPLFELYATQIKASFDALAAALKGYAEKLHGR